MNILRDIRFVFRLLIKYPGSSALAIMVLGFGLAASITIFTLINGIFWSSPNIGDGRHLVSIEWRNDKRIPAFIPLFNLPEYGRAEQLVQSLSDTAAYRLTNTALYYPDSDLTTKRYRHAMVTADFFKLVSVPPLLGRVFSKEDILRDAEHAVVISYSLWQQYFLGLPEAIGKTILLNGVAHTVVGVMPQGFHFPLNQQCWTVIRDYAASIKPISAEQIAAMAKKRPKLKRTLEARYFRRLHVIGALKPGYSLTRASADLNAVAKYLINQFPESGKDRGRISATMYNASLLGSQLISILTMLSVTAVLVFIIACANVSSLLMLRIARRRKELAIRKTLGAGRAHIVLQVLLEGFLLALGGLLVGLLLYASCSKFVWAWLQQSFSDIPYWWHMQLDWLVYLFAIGVVLLSTILSSALPAWRAVSKQTDTVLKDDTVTATGLFIGRVAKGMVAIQFACATVLLVMASMMILVMHYLKDWDLNYKPEQILTVRLQLNSTAGLPTEESVIQFLDSVSTQLKAMPGIDSVGFASNRAGVMQNRRKFDIAADENRPRKKSRYTSVNIVGADFFSVFDMRPAWGRLFSDSDTASAEPVAIVNRHFVDTYFYGENPVGQHIRSYFRSIRREGGRAASQATPWMKIVGVVPNIQRKLLPGQKPVAHAEIYIPVRQFAFRTTSLLLRAGGDVTRWIEPARRTIHRQSPKLAPTSEFKTVHDVLSENDDRTLTLTTIVIALGGIALLIAAAGLYGLISFTTLLQRREFGIRSALGAGCAGIIGLMLRRAAWLLLVGLLLGTAVTLTMSDLLKQNLNAIRFPVELPSHFMGITIVIVIGLIAFMIPALRAIRVPPVEALRVD